MIVDWTRCLGIFKANEVPIPEGGSYADTMPLVKRKYMAHDLQRFVKARGVTLNWPAHHPRRSVLALRTLLYLSAPESPYKNKLDMWTVVQRLFKAYWVEGVDISEKSALAAVLASLGVSPDVIDQANENETIKESLTTRTKEGIDRRLFGVPAFFVTVGTLNPHMLYGQDSLEELENMLGGKTHLDRLVEAPSKRLHPVTFFFDFSSPYTYIASARVERLFGAEHIKFVPVLLGAIFKAVGMANLPMTLNSPQKNEWSSTGLHQSCQALDLPFKFNSNFPIRTILPLRMVIVAGPDTPKGRKLIAAFFRAFWANDQNAADVSVCEKVANDCGFNGKELIAKANGAEGKNGLQKNTEEALARGLFGLPTVRPLFFPSFIHVSNLSSFFFTVGGPQSRR